MNVAITNGQAATLDLGNASNRNFSDGLCPILGALLGFMAMAGVFIFERSTLFIAA